jgi:hypothetical protein
MRNSGSNHIIIMWLRLFSVQSSHQQQQTSWFWR